MLKLYLFCVAWLLVGMHLCSQTIHFSQAYAAHLTLNPANTGRFNGSWRATGLIREQGYQFTNQYKTSYFSFEAPIYFKQERISTGFYYSHDISGKSNLPTESIYGNIAASVPVSSKGILTGGIQLGYVHKQLSWNNISFPEQYNRETGGFDPNLPTSEMFETDQASWLDIGLGILFAQKNTNALFIGGLALQQVNMPEVSFLGENYSLPLKKVAHFKVDWDLNHHYFLIPTGVGIWQNAAAQSLFGLAMGRNLNSWMEQKNNVLIGLHIRNGFQSQMDAMIVTTGFTYQYWCLTLSFDTDIMGSKTGYVSGSAFETSLVFKLPSTNISKKIVPCERY